jgi:hypothetical protein
MMLNLGVHFNSYAQDSHIRAISKSHFRPHLQKNEPRLFLLG